MPTLRFRAYFGGDDKWTEVRAAVYDETGEFTVGYTPLFTNPMETSFDLVVASGKYRFRAIYKDMVVVRDVNIGKRNDTVDFMFGPGRYMTESDIKKERKEENLQKRETRSKERSEKAYEEGVVGRKWYSKPFKKLGMGRG